MLKLRVAVSAIALAGSASAAGWHSLRVDSRVDTSSDKAFAESLAAFKDELSPARAYVFGEALKDIWVKGTERAEAEQREYAPSDYYRQVDGLRYEQVVTFADPTGETAKRRYRDFAQRYQGAGGRRYRDAAQSPRPAVWSPRNPWVGVPGVTAD